MSIEMRDVEPDCDLTAPAKIHAPGSGTLLHLPPLLPDNCIVEGDGAMASEIKDVTVYASRIRAALGRSVHAILEAAAIISAARDALDHASFRELAERLGMSKGTLSKFITIHSRRHRFVDREESLPTTWTVVYGLSKLPEQRFESLASSGKLQPDLSEKDLNRLVTQRTEAANPSASEQQAYLPVKVMVPALLSLEREDDIRRKIIEAVDNEPDVVVLFSGRRKAKASRR
jgi:hypothetical protein